MYAASAGDPGTLSGSAGNCADSDTVTRGTEPESSEESSDTTTHTGSASPSMYVSRSAG